MTRREPAGWRGKLDLRTRCSATFCRVILSLRSSAQNPVAAKKNLQFNDDGVGDLRNGWSRSNDTQDGENVWDGDGGAVAHPIAK